ncbi:DUF3560 domain-containing protein [Streptomyces spirodelae]|uniref:DUF3560 domain-containing protein n=1 Tax=Streptomyces spirodelae TaxID=2812904 RepID=A0ABS3X3E6_9ACTN|nr:DUF3560 domain-containing protein [Streptomyces spirodelae]MBO8189905.1 DUF3560 domain-containing protein [Streptomyces spirodelae]
MTATPAKGTITITHTRADGTLVEGTEKGDEAAKILKRKEYGRRGGLAFRWGYDLQCWYLRHSRDRAADQWTVNKLRGYLEEAGYTVVVNIDDHKRRSYAEAEAERIERAQARAERYDEYAGNAASRAEGAHRSADAISEYMTGEPIKVGHHSERRHRRDVERMDNHMRRGIEESRKASYWADRAVAAEHFEAFRRDPNRTLRRLEKLRKELRDIEKWQRGEPACGFTRSTTPEGLATLATERDVVLEKIAFEEAVIAEAEARGFKVWGPGDFTKGDFVNSGGTWREVLRVNKKSVTVPHLLTRTGMAVMRSGDRACTAGTVYYGRPSPCKGGKRCTCDTQTLPYDAVCGWASAADIARLEATEPEPEAERKVCPHCKRVAGSEKRFSPARGMCTVCGYAAPRNFKAEPAPAPEAAEHRKQVEQAPPVEEPAPAAETCPMCHSSQWHAEARRCAHCHHSPKEKPTPAPAPTTGEGWQEGLALVFIASRNSRPPRLRALWAMTRREAQAVCSDPRTSGRSFMLSWTEHPGDEGTDWEWITDKGTFAPVLEELGITPRREWAAAPETPVTFAQ